MNSVTINHPAYGQQEILFDEYLPPTRKELAYKSLGNKMLSIPLLGKGVRVELSNSFIIVQRCLSVPNDLALPVGTVIIRGKRNRYIVKSAKVDYVFMRNGNLDTIRTNKKIYETYNELTKDLMITARKNKISHFERDIKNLSK